jgi:hypothetical protein
MSWHGIAQFGIGVAWRGTAPSYCTGSNTTNEIHVLEVNTSIPMSKVNIISFNEQKAKSQTKSNRIESNQITNQMHL